MKLLGLFEMLYGDKVVSHCCKECVKIELPETECMYYVCEACLKPCRLIKDDGSTDIATQGK